MIYDIVLLSAPGYLSAKEDSILLQNVVREDQLVADALGKEGLKVVRKSWDDRDFDWTTTKFALFRSTWDYIHRVKEFEQWLESVSAKTQLINSKKLIDWNLDKHYFQDLKVQGVHIPKTVFIERGSDTSLYNSWELAQRSYGFQGSSLILKPCISGGARHTYKIESKTIPEYEEVFGSLIKNEAMMLQEFQKSIVEKGEISLMVFHGEYTHAVLKVAKTGDFRVQDDFGGSVHEYHPSEAEIQFALKTVYAAPELPMYARVDIFQDNDGQLALAELEIFEPELWFRNNPSAAAVLAKHIKNKLF
ncbi:ATP-grasp domain-containing protein [Flagellimonas flava]|uniref:ATP-grasp domain-containing protein n=1 Tax=Flagellimonas flava TaxID=570519 RepID=UPI003D655723